MIRKSLMYLGLDTKEGRDLEQLVRKEVDRTAFQLECKSSFTLWESTLICQSYDAVIIDASIDEGGNNFESICELAKFHQHILVVSRTMLPINFRGLRPGGAPRFDQRIFTNQRIVEWLKSELKAIENLSRPLKWLQRFGTLGTIAEGAYRGYHSVGVSRDFERAASQVFLSYRSVYSESAKKVKGTSKEAVRLYEPAQLGDALHTEQMRWTLLAQIRADIDACKEFWILLTEDYLNSWWTRGELVLYAYHHAADPHIRIWRPPFTDSEDGNHLLPNLSESDRKRAARFLAHCDPAEMGPESYFITKPEMIRRGWVPEHYRDHVYSDEFWLDPILRCRACQRRLEREDRTGFNVEDFLWTREADHHRVPRAEFEKAVAAGTPVRCPSPACNGSEYVELADPVYVLLTDPGSGRGGQTPKNRLLKLPAYRLSSSRTTVTAGRNF